MTGAVTGVRSEWTQLPANPVHAAVVGPDGAPAVVAVPGMCCSHRYVLPFARAAAPPAQVSVPDLPGTGRSPGPRHAMDVPQLSRVLARWLEATGRGGAVLVASSGGCGVALELTRHAPELLGPLVLVGPAPDPHAGGPVRHALRGAVEALREPRVVPPIAVDWLLDAGPARVLGTLRHALRHRVDDAAVRVRTPAVVVRGRADPLASRATAARLTALIPGARCAELPGAAHALTTTAPHRLAALVHELLPAARTTRT